MTAQTTEELLKVYDSYRGALKAKRLEAALAPLIEKVREETREELRDPENQALLEFLVPLSYETVGITWSKSGQKATLYFVGTFRVPEEVQKESKTGPTTRMEYFIEFQKEGGVWKMGLPTITGDPNGIARPADLNMGVSTDYAESSVATVGGRIVKVEPAKQGTVYLIRVTDEEIAVWVRPEVKYEASEFIPGQIVEFEGSVHKADKRKMLARTAKVYPY
jgi:hypothetical protein